MNILQHCSAPCIHHGNTVQHCSVPVSALELFYRVFITDLNIKKVTFTVSYCRNHLIRETRMELEKDYNNKHYAYKIRYLSQRLLFPTGLILLAIPRVPCPHQGTRVLLAFMDLW